MTTPPTTVKNAKPIDWISVALAFSMPVLIALEPYVQNAPNSNLPPMGSALLIAALGSLVAQIDAMRRKRAAADEA